MASVQELPLPPELRTQLLARGLRTARDCLHHTATDLCEILDISYGAAQQLLLDVAAQAAPGYITASQLYGLSLADSATQLRTFLPGLDAALRVGVPAGAITELVGPAGVGKSQMAMGLALSAALPRELGGLAATVMYIDTEGKLSVPRMQEIALARASAFAPQLADFQQQQQQQQQAAQQQQDGPGSGGGGGGSPQAEGQQLLDELAMSALDRVLIVKPGSLEALRVTLGALEEQVPLRGVRLVVLDSVAALLRMELGGGRTQLVERGETVGRQAVALKALAERHRIPIVVTNQVTSRPTGPAVHAFQGAGAPPTAAARAGGGGDEGHLAAALGTKWAHSVNVRLVLERQGNQRFIKIAKSPLSPNVAFEYAVTAAGVQQVGSGPVAPQAGGGAQVAGSAMAMPILNQQPPEVADWGDGGGW